MFDLFRFIAVRPPREADETDTVSIATSSEFQGELGAARNGESPRIAMQQIAQGFMGSHNFVRDLSSLTYYQQLRDFSSGIAQAKELNPTKLHDLVSTLFQADPKDLVSNENFLRDKERVFDSLVALMIVPIGQPLLTRDLSKIVPLFALIERIAAEDEALDQPDAAQEALTRTLLLPATIFPLPSPSERVGHQPGMNGHPQPTVEVEQHISELANRASSIEAAIEMLLATDPASFVPSVLSPAPELTNPPSSGTSLPATIHQIAKPSLMLKTEAIHNLDPAVKAVLQDTYIDLALTPLPIAIDCLQNELVKTSRALNQSLASLPRSSVAALGRTLLPAPAGNVRLVTPPAPPLPTTHGAIKSVGIGDLLVVKQQLKRYEAGEISYIENVLKGETKKRQTRRTRTTEETFLTETETVKEEERDLQSTERFELKQETDTTIKDDASVKAGVAISASYGGTLEIKSNLDVATSSSREEATKQATSYSKDVTNRAASKVTERVREQKTLKIVEQFEELDEHGMDNTNGNEHIIGIYQWIDKIYEAQVYNYGKRLLFDVMVPEPAAFLIDAMTLSQNQGQSLVKPIPFTATPDDITEANYSYYVSLYDVTGVEPPPAPTITVSKTFDDRPNKGDQPKTAELPLPDGYSAWYGWADVESIITDTSKAQLMLAIGEYLRLVKNGSYGGQYVTLAGEVGSLPIALSPFDTEAYAVAIEINCARTPRALTQWKLKTHDAIMQAYLKMQGDYEDKLAALAVQQGVQFPAHSPDQNRILEKAELKKACLSLLTATHLDFFDAVDEPGMPPKKYPQVDLAQADLQGNYIRFFEQAFEWEQMMYFFYPYFWGRQSNWYERALLEDADPMFVDFLKAGAARVVFPVRPGFENAIGNFLDTGQILDFSDIGITSPLYLPITQEIKESQDAKGQEVPQGDPWDVRLPTTLVKLRADSSLPKWKKDASGDWVPDESA